MRFKIGDWVRSLPFRNKGSFVGQIVDTIGHDYIVRDAERRKWLRTDAELRPAVKEPA
jgi:hypothetical protein